MACPNHPEAAETKRGAKCRSPFCDACLVPVHGVSLCGTCRDAWVERVGRAPSATVHRLRLLRIRSLIWALGALGLMTVLLAVQWPIPAMAVALLMVLLFATTLLAQLLLWAIDFQQRRGPKDEG